LSSRHREILTGAIYRIFIGFKFNCNETWEQNMMIRCNLAYIILTIGGNYEK